MAPASDVATTNGADLEPYFCSTQLIPAANGFDQTSAQKDTCHFPNIAKETGVDFEDMLVSDGLSSLQPVASIFHNDAPGLNADCWMTLSMTVAVQFFDDEAKNVKRVRFAWCWSIVEISGVCFHVRMMGVVYKQRDLERLPWHQVARLGTTAVLVDTSAGMTMDVLLQGLRLYASRGQTADG